MAKAVAAMVKPTSSSTMETVDTALAPRTPPPVGALSKTLKASLVSIVVSFIRAMSTVLENSPAAKDTVVFKAV